jgi:hypothetical protein
MDTKPKQWLGIVAATVALLSFAALQAPAETLRASRLRPGETLSAENATLAEGLLPPEILAFYARGDWTNRIAEWPDGKMQRDREFVEGTRANAGRFTVDDGGSIVERAGGKRSTHLIGLPFADIDAADPKAGVEIIWNYFFGSYNVGNLKASIDLACVGRKGVDRAASLTLSTLYYDGQKAKYQPSENPQGLLMQVLTAVASPQDLANTSFLVWRFRDPDKRDLDWTYLPAFRRVRQLSPANRSDGFLGSDLTQDDGMFFDGKPEDFTWKLIGESEAYRLADPYSLAGAGAAPQPIAGGGWRASFHDGPIVGFEDSHWSGAPWAPVSAVLARRKVWIVEATPKDSYYLYGKIELAIDRETFQGVWSRKFSKSGELLADFLPASFVNTEVVAADGAKEWIAAPGMTYYVAVNAKMDRATVTGFPLKDRAHAAIDARVKQEPNLFDFQALGRAGN